MSAPSHDVEGNAPIVIEVPTDAISSPEVVEETARVTQITIQPNVLAQALRQVLQEARSYPFQSGSLNDLPD